MENKKTRYFFAATMGYTINKSSIQFQNFMFKTNNGEFPSMEIIMDRSDKKDKNMKTEVILSISEMSEKDFNEFNEN